MNELIKHIIEVIEKEDMSDRDKLLWIKGNLQGMLKVLESSYNNKNEIMDKIKTIIAMAMNGAGVSEEEADRQIRVITPMIENVFSQGKAITGSEIVKPPLTR